MKGPLHGIRVVELSTMITGPLTGMMLADMGADVVKVENPEGGDPFRSYGGGNYSAQYCSYNRNKRSVALSLRTDLGRRALEKLIARSDVLLENFRAGVLDRLGFPQERIMELNPRIIRCSITGFGADGPYASRACYDAIAQGLSGMSNQFLDPEQPRLAGITVPDNVTGQYACYGILAALFERERTGIARRIDVNMLEASVAFMPEPFGYYTQNGEVADAYLRIRNSQAFVFRCSDDKMISIHLSSQQKFWERFVAAIGMPELATDPAYETVPARVENYEELSKVASGVFRSHSRDHWLEVLETADVPAAPVYDVTEVMNDPQIRHLESFVSYEHPEKGRLVTIRRPVRIDGSRSDQPLSPPPMLGEHTGAVLSELGLEPEPLA